MRVIDSEKLELLLQKIDDYYNLYLPLSSPDGSRFIGKLGDGALLLDSAAVTTKPFSILFPQTEILYSTASSVSEIDKTDKRMTVLFGLSSSDMFSLKHIDIFFSDPPEDDIYIAKRSNTVVAAWSLSSGYSGAEIELSENDGQVMLTATSENGRLFLEQLDSFQLFSIHDVNVEKAPARHATNNKNIEIVLQASSIMLEEELPQSFWEEVAASCILCTGCNMVCPTCSCFGVEDLVYKERCERIRFWDSCQLEGFTREGGGHNPMAKQWQRVRRRIHHKLVADRKRWGKISCTACGRCDEACPTGIGMLRMAEKILSFNR